MNKELRKLNIKIGSYLGLPQREIRAVNTLLSDKKVYNYVDIERYQ